MIRSYKYETETSFISNKEKYNLKLIEFNQCKKDLLEVIPKDNSHWLNTLLSIHSELFEIKSSDIYSMGFKEGSKLMLEIFEKQEKPEE